MSVTTAFTLLGFLFALPLAAWLAARFLLKGGSGFVKAIENHALAEWHGVFYAFDDIQVRVFEDDGRLWFVGVDVARALGWKALPQRFLSTRRRLLRVVPGTKLQALDFEGLEVLLGARREVACGRFLRWARMEVVAPWHNQRSPTQERLVPH